MPRTTTTNSQCAKNLKKLVQTWKNDAGKCDLKIMIIDSYNHLFFQVTTHFSGCFEKCFESELPEFTDCENKFSWSLDQKSVFWL